MSQIIVSIELGQHFAAANTMAEVRDENGKILGHFVPTPPPDVIEKLQPQIDEQEVRRRLAAGGGRSLAQIWTDLGVGQ